MFKKLFGEVDSSFPPPNSYWLTSHAARREERGNALPQAFQPGFNSCPHPPEAKECGSVRPSERPEQGGDDPIRPRRDGSTSNWRSTEEHAGVPWRVWCSIKAGTRSKRSSGCTATAQGEWRCLPAASSKDAWPPQGRR